MLFPFQLQSLTHEVDQEIHRIVRRAAPYKYWIFRIADVVARVGAAFVLFMIVMYVLGQLFLKASLPVTGAEHEQVASFFAHLLVVTGVPAVGGYIVRDGLRRELRQAVRSASQSITNA
jgi:hypothetical protein